MRSLRLFSGRRSRSRGQAMIEYIVVLAFGVIVLIRGDGGTDPPVKQLADAIRNYHKHYTYGISIATIPECDYTYAYDKSVNLADVMSQINSTKSPSVGGAVTASVDRCVDWQNPSIPVPDITFEMTMAGFGTSVTTMLTDKVKEYVKDFVSDFLNPSGLLGDMFSFNIGDLF